MKKIISFCLWGDNPKYTEGAIENIKLQKQLFPSWICRFYIHTSVSTHIYDKIKNEGCEIIEKNEIPVIGPMNYPGWFWRFEVLKDKDVERCISRDVDSRLTQREKNCIIDWQISGKEFHIIRDHPLHSTKILAGMWGATKSFIDRINYDELINSFNHLSYNNVYCTDQEFLARMIYPLVKDSACIHDDWDRYGEGARKIPHFRINNEFIGEPYEIML